MEVSVLFRRSLLICYTDLFLFLQKFVNFIDQSFKIKEPGFCVKAHIEGESSKFFINFCHSITVEISFF